MLKKGSRVCWTSQAHGYASVKEGVIVAVVPKDESPQFHVPVGFKLRLPGMPRDHTSFLVKVKGNYLYWPRVKDLEQIE